jgi:UDP-N-acetylmuramoylalanine-D-glutamate ligase
MKLFLSIIVSLPLVILAQDQENNAPKTPFEYTKKIYKELEEIKSIKPEDYFTHIDEYRAGLEKYIDHKKRVCEGEFSFIILNDSTADEKRNTTNKKNKLSKEEQALCFRELKALQITFINNMYVARKRYLDYLHAKRIEELQNTRDNAVKDLSKQFNKRVVGKRR